MMESNCDITFKRRVILLSAVIGVIFISSPDITVNASSNFYDQHESDEPIFRDVPSSDEYAAISLTDDSRFANVEPSWELNLNQESKPLSSKSKTKRKVKRNCAGLPSIAARGLIGSTIKRAEFAINRSELENRLFNEEQTRKKREIKRNGVISEQFWTCETKYEWLDMGMDHYPRYVRSAKCQSRRCGNGLFTCHPRIYKTKVLKRVSASDSPACEETDDSLPETLRPDWQLKSISIVHCCSCGINSK